MKLRYTATVSCVVDVDPDIYPEGSMLEGIRAIEIDNSKYDQADYIAGMFEYAPEVKMVVEIA